MYNKKMETEIIKLEEDLRQAMLTNDIFALNKLIDDSLIFIAPNGMVATKQMDLDAHRNKIQKMTELSPSEQQIKIHENFAIVTVKMKITGTYSDFDISGDYRYMRIWKKINDTWKIISGSVVKVNL